MPFPSIADALYLGLYPGCYLGLILLLKRRAGKLTAGVWLDGLIGALGFASLAAALLIGAVVSDTGGDLIPVTTNIAYPLADVLLISIVVAMVAVFGRGAGRTARHRLAGGAAAARTRRLAAPAPARAPRHRRRADGADTGGCRRRLAGAPGDRPL